MQNFYFEEIKYTKLLFTLLCDISGIDYALIYTAF